MAKPLLSDDLWETVAPLLPEPKPRPKGGRPPVANRAALTGILFVLRSGIPWELLPAEMGCGSGMSCWRRLRDWQAAGVWVRLHRALLERTHAWLNTFRRLRIRYEVRDDIYDAFTTLGDALVVLNQCRRFC